MVMIRRLRSRGCLLAACTATLLMSACDDSSHSSPPIDANATPDASKPDPDAATAVALQIKTLSNRADLISGGDALVEIVVQAGALSPSQSVHVTAGDRDVSSAFARRSDGRVIGLVTGLGDGPTMIAADIAGHGKAGLTITNHPIGGPVFSGPQVLPWICAHPQPTAESGDTPFTNQSGLKTEPVDAQCNAMTEFNLYYRSTAAGCSFSLPDPVIPPPPQAPPVVPSNLCFRPYDPSAARPTDLAMTTTDTNVTVPYIVRVERGTMNRGIYDIAVLVDPNQLGASGWNPTAPPTTWNRKLLYTFGASTGQPRHQERSTQVWTSQDDALKRGFLVAANSMTDSSLNSNRVSMTETLMMMKEHIIDTYGEIRYSMGSGCSGGSINQLTSSSIYPTLLDGIQPSCTYSDSETTGMEVSDCELLVRFYASATWKNLLATENQALPVPLSSDDLAKLDFTKQTAINGHLDQNACHGWFNSFIGIGRPGNYHHETVSANGTITAATATTNNCGLPATQVYPMTDVRCTGQDHAVSIWGTVDGTHRAPSTSDNTGVVYGLKAFQAGKITAEEFVTLNESIGGADFDLNPASTRTVADPGALATAYRAGIVMSGKNLAKTPILDLRGWDEQGIHYIWRSFALRARLDAANGGHANHVLWRFPATLTPPAASGLTQQSFLMMDKWLAALHADTSTVAIEQRVITDKPTDAVDFCYLSIDTNFLMKVTFQALCDEDPGLQAHSSPRQVAGGPITEDILKCQLKPFTAADYPGLSDTQLARLQTAFPDGVCNWTLPGVGQQAAVSPLDFTAGPGGVSLPASPASQPL